MIHLMYLSGIVILTIFVIAMIVLTVRQRSKYVLSKDCTKPLGEFAVIPNTVGTNIISSCGDDGKSACIFKNITSLGQATNICNENVLRCDRFIYDPKNESMTIIAAGPVSDVEDVDMYIRQVNYSII